MAHSVSRATFGLTHPAQINALKIACSAKEGKLEEWKGDLVAVGVLEKDMAKDDNSKFQNPIFIVLDAKLGGLLSQASSEEDFTGKVGQYVNLRVSALGSKQIGLVGLGQGLPTSYRTLGEVVASAAKSSHTNSVAIVLASSDGISAKSKLHSAAATANESKKPAIKSVDIIGLGTGPELEKKLKYAEDVCAVIIFGRELVNSPANVLTPGALAEEAVKIAKSYADVLSSKILDVEQCKELKMGSYLGVAAASSNLPHFIHLCYKPPNGPAKTKLALVGKGLTFDSPIMMSARELESGNAGEPAKLIRQRYREAADIIKKGKMCCLFINDIDAGAGGMGGTAQYTSSFIISNSQLTALKIDGIKETGCVSNYHYTYE